VFELEDLYFSNCVFLAAGATLCKGLNRGLGTLLAGLLAFIVGYIANASSHRISQAVIIGAAVFLIGTLHTCRLRFPAV